MEHPVSYITDKYPEAATEEVLGQCHGIAYFHEAYPSPVPIGSGGGVVVTDEAFYLSRDDEFTQVNGVEVVRLPHDSTFVSVHGTTGVAGLGIGPKDFVLLAFLNVDDESTFQDAFDRAIDTTPLPMTAGPHSPANRLLLMPPDGLPSILSAVGWVAWKRASEARR
jgi:hypothetical protein